MRDRLNWIAALMKQNAEAVGFIPLPTVQSQYIATGRYVFQTDEVGIPVGYLLHGAVVPGRTLVISQHCIDHEKRLRGYGEQAFKTVVERARSANCRGIALHCAADLESNAFWSALGLQHVSTKTPLNTRRRAVHVYILDLWPTLWDCRSHHIGFTRCVEELNHSLVVSMKHGGNA